MNLLPTSLRIYLASAPTDMRKGFDGLANLVNQAGLDLFDGSLYVFVSRRRTHLKILTWDNKAGALVLYYKRLEKGRFKLPHLQDDQNTVSLEPYQLALLLEGLESKQLPRQPTWMPAHLR